MASDAAGDGGFDDDDGDDDGDDDDDGEDDGANRNMMMRKKRGLRKITKRNMKAAVQM